MTSTRYAHLQEQYDNLPDGTEKIDVLTDMVMEIRNDEPERALSMAEEIILQAESIKYFLGIGNGHNHKGACYWLLGEYEDGLDELTMALNIANDIQSEDLKARALNNFGRIYRELGDIATALRYFESSLEINEKLHNELNLTINLTNISNLYYDLGDYDTALEYALKCLPIYEKYVEEQPLRLVAIYTTLGNIYFKKEIFKEALHYFQSIKNLATPDTAAFKLAHSGLGKVFYKMSDFENAKKYLDLSLEFAKEMNNPEHEITALYYTGHLYKDQMIYRKALDFFQQSYKLAQEYMRKQDLLSIHEALSDLYDQMGDIPKAFHHLKSYETLKEEIFQQATLNKLRNLQIKNQIEVAKKEKEVAEQTAHLKQQFMANMSHEIRTPMNAIVGMTRLLIDKSPKPEQMKYLNAIRKASDNLLVIINDILDLSKIEAGKIIIEKIDFSISELLNSLREIMMIKAEEKNLDFYIEPEKNIPDRLVGDPTRVSQVLINLVGNAIKFTEKGSVKLKCNLVSQEAERLSLSFKIIDTGIGISETYVSRIFESFTQAGTDTARKYGGTGLGLTISKQLTDLMDGDIQVESKLDIGTTFTITLPFDVASSQEKPVTNTDEIDEVKKSLANVTVLLVEDNEFNRMVAEDTLRELLPHIKLDYAENGAVAIDKVKSKNYDLLLMDIQMPVMDGIEATRVIRNKLDERKCQVPIIAMTANVLQEDVKLYFQEGMNAYVSKPFQPDELLQKMADVINPNYSHQPKNNFANDKPQERVLPSKVTDMAFLNQFTGGNNEKKKKYIQMFLENGPRLLATIERSLAVGDYESLKVAAHSMKPQFSYMGIAEDVSHIFLTEQSAGQSAHFHLLPQLVQDLKRVCDKAFEELKHEIIA